MHRRGMTEIFEVTEIFFMIVVMVSWLCVFIKIHKTAHYKVNFTNVILYIKPFNKPHWYCED